MVFGIGNGLNGKATGELLVVGVSDMKFSVNPNDTIITYALGSCLALSLYDPVACVGGMAHCMLPLSRLSEQRAQLNPYMFTDTGVPALFETVLAHGASLQRLVAKVAGCAAPMEENGTFKIGDRNYTVLRKILWKNNLLIAGESVGGNAPRTFTLSMADGTTSVRTEGNVFLI